MVRRIVIIGTGPISMLKAYFIGKQNPMAHITLIDSGQQIGGAWYSDVSPKGSEIECGCHIWSYNPKVYQFIEQQLDVPLFPMSVNPVFVGKRIKLPYSIKNTVDTYKVFFKFLFTLQWRKIASMKKNPYQHFKLFGKKNKYPKLGSTELIHAIKSKLNSLSNVEIVLNTNVTSINVLQQVEIKAGESLYHADILYLTYVSKLAHLIINKKVFDIAIRQVDYVHFLIALDQPLLKTLSYWRLMNDEVVHRITDISYQSKHQENLILVGIKGDAFHRKSEDVLVNHVKELFLRYKLINASFEFTKIKTHVFPTHYIKHEALDELKKFDDKIKVMHTTDLIYGLHTLLTEEKIIS